MRFIFSKQECFVFWPQVAIDRYLVEQGWGYFETDRDKSEWVGSSLNGLDRLEWYKLVKRYGAHQYALGQAVIEKVPQNGIALLHFFLHLINPKTQKMITLVKVDY